MTTKDQLAGQTDQNKDQKVNVDGKDYTPEDVKSLLENSASVTQKAQQVQKILDAAKAYGVEPDEFVQHAEGAFSVITNLRDQGLINQDGEVVIPKVAKVPGKETTELDEEEFLTGLIPEDEKKKRVSKSDSAVLAALNQINKKLQALEGSVVETRDTQTLMARLTQQDKIKAVYPDLQDEDISRVFAETARLRSQGKKTSIMDVAKLVNEDAVNRRSTIERAFAERHNINYDQLKAGQTDKPKSMAELDEAGIMAVTGQKKINLFPKPGKGEVTPAAALKGFLLGGK